MNVQEIIKKIYETLLYTEYAKRYRICIVDDNSPDNTGKIAEKLHKKYPVDVIHRLGKRGYGAACKEGLKNALLKSNIIVTMDCDFSHNPVYLPFFLEKINEGYDVVIGSRYINGGEIKNWSLMRRIMSKFANKFTRFFLDMPVSDCTSGFRVYKKEVLEGVGIEKIQAEGYSFLEEILYAANHLRYKITEIPILFVERRSGASKLSKKEMMHFIITIIKLKIKESNERKTQNLIHL